MWWRKRKEKSEGRKLTEVQERVVRRIAENIISFQRKWSVWMGSWFNKLPSYWQKCLLIVFVLSVSLILIWPFLTSTFK